MGIELKILFWEPSIIAPYCILLKASTSSFCALGIVVS